LFLTPDPYLLDGGNLNPRDYAYNPLRQIDPTGLSTFTVGPAGGDADHHPVPNPNQPGEVPAPGHAPGDTLTTGASSVNELSRPGPWAVGASGANGNSTPGFVPCPSNKLDNGQFDRGTSLVAAVDAAGNAYGCHTCGAKESGWPDNSDGTGHWTADHIPPRETYRGDRCATEAGNYPPNRNASRSAPSDGSVRLYPQCQRCSRAQSNAVRHGASQDSAGRARALMAEQSGLPMPP
jgi:hypothetical protein